MSRNSWVNVQFSGVTLEVPGAKDFKLLEYCWLEGCTGDSDIPITMGMATKALIKLDLSHSRHSEE